MPAVDQAPLEVNPPAELPFVSVALVRDLDDYTSEVVEVPEWGMRCRIGTMSGKQRGLYDARMARARRGKHSKSPAVPHDFREWIVALCVHDENRKRVFSDSDVVMLGTRSVVALDRIFEAACKLNGLSADDVEEEEKNSDGSQNGDSGSD